MEANPKGSGHARSGDVPNSLNSFFPRAFPLGSRPFRRRFHYSSVSLQLCSARYLPHLIAFIINTAHKPLHLIEPGNLDLSILPRVKASFWGTEFTAPRRCSGGFGDISLLRGGTEGVGTCRWEILLPKA